jgi:HK97 family phage major capsid protein
MEIKELNDALVAATGDIKGSLEVQAKEVKSIQDNAEVVAKEVKSSIDGVSTEVKAVDDRLTKLETKSNRSIEGQLMERKSAGQQFVESTEFKERGSNLKVNHVELKQSGMITKDIDNGSGSAFALTTQYRNPTIFRDPNRQVLIRDLLTTLPITDSAVEVMRELVFTNSAAPQAGELVAKAKSDITYSQETYVVQTMAHYIIASRQIISDVPRLQAEIDGRLMYGLDLLSDNQLLLGDGTGNNLTGLMVDAAVPDLGASAAETGTIWVDFIRSGVTALQLANYSATAVVVSPADWEILETSKGTDGHYIWATVPQGGEARMWRIPVVVSNAMPEGSFLMGDFAMGATVYDRQQKSVFTSDSHADLFVRNGVAILAEERLAFAIERPNAFIKGTLTAAA